MVQSEDEGQTAECLFTTGEVANVLPALLGGHDAEENAFAEGIQAVDEFELCVSAHGDHLIHFLESERDGAETFHETFQAQTA